MASVLTEEQLEHYFREGYVLAPSLASIETVQAVLRDAPREANASGRWQARVFDHAHPENDAPLHRLLVDPGIVGAVRDIFANTPRIWYGMLAVVPARGGTGLPWHQDNQYTRLVGPALNVFVALSEIPPEKAGLWVAPRSHLLGQQEARINQDTAPGHREALIDPANGMPLPAMRSGDVCIFDRMMLHRSLRNETDEDRYAYAAQYLGENTRLAETGAKDPLRMPAAELARRWTSLPAQLVG